MEKSIFITGGAGYIGSHIAKLFLESGYKAVIFDNLSTGFKEAVEKLSSIGSLVFEEGDLLDYERIKSALQKHKPDCVVHCGALLSVDESMKFPEKYFKNNVGGSMNLFEAMKETGIKNIVFSSTCAVYGEIEDNPVSERHPTSPTNPYGETKLIIEQMLRWYGKLSEINYAILRYFNVCGASSDGLIGDGRIPPPHLIQRAVRGGLGIDSFEFTCPEMDTPDKTPVRDYIDVEDIAEAHKRSYETLLINGKSGIYNVGTGKGNSVKEIVSKVEEVLGVSIPKEEGEKRKGEYAKVYADNTKLKKDFGWVPERNIEESIRKLVSWYKEHPNGYK